MTIRISLFLVCLAIVGIATPLNAEISKSVSANQASARVKNLEAILRESGLCKHYPVVVKILNDNTALIATYGDRQLSDKEIKLLALHMAKLISSNVSKNMAVSVRLYDAASTKYWKDIALSSAQIQSDLKSKLQEEQILSSIEIVNNFGLVDGPNLKPRIELYKQILKLQQVGVDVKPFLAQLAQIEVAEKNKQNINAQMTELGDSLTAAEPVVTPIAGSTHTSEAVDSLEQSLKDACEKEAAALKAVQAAEQERQDLALPEASDIDSQDRYIIADNALQQKIESALSDLHEARRYRDFINEQLMQAKQTH